MSETLLDVVTVALELMLRLSDALSVREGDPLLETLSLTVELLDRDTSLVSEGDELGEADAEELIEGVAETLALLVALTDDAGDDEAVGDADAVADTDAESLSLPVILPLRLDVAVRERDTL